MKRINSILTALLLFLAVSVTLPSQSLALSEICFEESVAKSLLTEVKTNRETIVRQKSIISLLKDEIAVDEQMTINLAERLSLMDDQLVDSNKRAEGYKLEWQKTNDALVKCETSKPERWTWFSMGAGSGIGLALLLLIL